LFAIQAKREGVKKKEIKTGGRWFGGLFGNGKQTAAEIQTVGRLL